MTKERKSDKKKDDLQEKVKPPRILCFVDDKQGTIRPTVFISYDGGEPIEVETYKI